MTVEQLFEKMTKGGLFIGNYDAQNGSQEFMHGIQLVMEYIAYQISEECYEEFSNLFTNNLLKSEKYAKVEERIHNLKIMNNAICNLVDDEELWEIWITLGVPDEASEEDYRYIAENDEEYADTERLWHKLMRKSREEEDE